MRLSVFIILLLFTFISQAQTGKLKGVVTDISTKETLIGATVQVGTTNQGAVTDIDGNYTLDLAPGTYKIIYSYAGYENITKDITIKSNETITIDIEMSEANEILNEIVVTGSKYEKKLGEETVSIDVIKPVAIEKQNQNNVNQAINRSPGVVVIDGQVNIRGGSGYSYGAGSRVLILMDDMPVVQADAGFPNWSSIPVENIGQIEIIKGAASALYGSAAMNGIINIRTAYPTNKPMTKISFFNTIHGQPKPEYDENGNEVENAWWKRDSFRLNGELINLNEYDRPYEAGFSVAHKQKFGKYDMVIGAMGLSGNDFRFGGYEKRFRYNMLNRVRLNEKNSIGVNFNLQFGRSQTFFLWKGFEGVDKYLPGDLTGKPTTTRSFRFLVDPYWTYSDTKGNSHKVLGRYFRINNDNDNNQGNFSDYYYGEYQYQRHIDKIGMVVSGGLVSSFTTVDAELYGGGTLKGRNIAGYAQVDQKLFDKLNLAVGFRFESNKISNTETQTRPVVRAGINYQPAKYTFIRASFGQGYRFPTIAEKFISTKLSESFGILPNTNLKSETGYSAELGVKQGIKLGKLSCLFDIAGFYTQYKDMMEFNPTTSEEVTFGFQSQNVGNTRIYGVETSLGGTGKVGKTDHLFLAGYTYIVPKFVDFNDEAQQNSTTEYNVLKYRFRHQFTGNYDFSYKFLDVGFTMQYYSFMENVDYVFALAVPGLAEWRDSRLKEDWESKKPQHQHFGDFIMDARVGFRFSQDHGKISFLVKNLTNRTYSIRPAMMEAPVNYSVRLDFNF